MNLISPENIKIEILNNEHNVKHFTSYEKELVKFLQEDALENQKQNLSLTFIWFYKREIAAYITLLNDSISLEGDLKEAFREKGVLYKALPALKVGRLCVDDKYLRRGLGTLMLAFAVKVANRIFNNYSGCRFIVLDAKRNKENDVIQFYKRIGFKRLKEREKGTTPMFLDLVNDAKFHL